MFCMFLYKNYIFPLLHGFCDLISINDDRKHDVFLVILISVFFLYICTCTKNQYHDADRYPHLICDIFLEVIF